VPIGLRPGGAVPAEGPLKTSASCVPQISLERRRAFRQNRAGAPVAQLIAVLLKLAVFTGRHSHIRLKDFTNAARDSYPAVVAMLFRF
jgi:hypothetical protein